MQDLSGLEFVAIRYPYNQPNAILITPDKIQTNTQKHAYCAYIQEHQVKQADIMCDSIDFVENCPSLEHLRIRPPISFNGMFDFSPLYAMPRILSLTVQNKYGFQNQLLSTIDFSRINGLVDVFVSVNQGTINYDNIDTLKSLRIVGYKSRQRNLSGMFSSKELDTLSIMQSNITSLEGVDRSDKLQCLYLSHNKSLQDISALRKVKHTLRALRIINCPQIQDFSVLTELDHLELLELTGNNVIDNIQFVGKMASLKTFVFSMNVEDGDLSPCLKLSYVHCSKPRKHYNVPSKALPKNSYHRGNENIEEWRRLE